MTCLVRSYELHPQVIKDVWENLAKAKRKGEKKGDGAKKIKNKFSASSRGNCSCCVHLPRGCISTIMIIISIGTKYFMVAFIV